MIHRPYFFYFKMLLLLGFSFSSSLWAFHVDSFPTYGSVAQEEVEPVIKNGEPNKIQESAPVPSFQIMEPSGGKFRYVSANQPIYQLLFTNARKVINDFHLCPSNKRCSITNIKLAQDKGYDFSRIYLDVADQSFQYQTKIITLLAQNNEWKFHDLHTTRVQEEAAKVDFVPVAAQKLIAAKEPFIKDEQDLKSSFNHFYWESNNASWEFLIQPQCGKAVEDKTIEAHGNLIAILSPEFISQNKEKKYDEAISKKHFQDLKLLLGTKKSSAADINKLEKIICSCNDLKMKITENKNSSWGIMKDRCVKYDWEGTTAYTAEFTNAIPFLSLNPGWVKKSEGLEITLGHEWYHAFGYDHIKDIDYPYACSHCAYFNKLGKANIDKNEFSDEDVLQKTCEVCLTSATTSREDFVASVSSMLISVGRPHIGMQNWLYYFLRHTYTQKDVELFLKQISSAEGHFLSPRFALFNCFYALQTSATESDDLKKLKKYCEDENLVSAANRNLLSILLEPFQAAFWINQNPDSCDAKTQSETEKMIKAYKNKQKVSESNNEVLKIFYGSLADIRPRLLSTVQNCLKKSQLEKSLSNQFQRLLELLQTDASL